MAGTDSGAVDGAATVFGPCCQELDSIDDATNFTDGVVVTLDENRSGKCVCHHFLLDRTVSEQVNVSAGRGKPTRKCDGGLPVSYGGVKLGLVPHRFFSQYASLIAEGFKGVPGLVNGY